ncbi:cytochrome c oxidase assembly protein [Roseomonas sp. NAR14]|uniref:Cytochrome c oxidase assembly protein n=1 Tax=Roseomonas acroporae TaxID=2937791 RepID=A0A9X1YB51_9PROT|nr:cytochrome c oxidase assembly protein [Roseomonas acroporae]MCK8787504.1 cytochrome c oxidase assembly protein [Roseomonas acroporae]
MPETGLAYCGAPPLPGGLAWNPDPLLLAALLLGLLPAWRAAGRSGGSRRSLLAGWGLLALALLSPLCGLSVALFSARVAQHLVILLAAAPLLALALPARAPAAGSIAASVPAFAVALWAWHMPGPYALALHSHLAYWAMHASLLATACWLWRGLLARLEAALVAGVVTAAQTGALGALLTMAPRALFADHALTTLPWGLTPLEDQQLGGLLMWVPGGLVFAAAAAAALMRSLRGTGEAA